MWGERGEAQHQKKANGSINDELGRRFRVELLEDKDRLDLPHLNRASHDDICSLATSLIRGSPVLGRIPVPRSP